MVRPFFFMTALIGTVLGRYEILGVIGRGTMGAVYKARDPKIDRLVAIKTIALEGLDPADEQEYRERFFQEARAAGRLAHPGIVTIFDVGEEPGSRDPYIVMEYIAGRQLDHAYPHSGKKLPPALALRLIEEIAEALDYAHRQGVIHRDIKPANILITEQGKPKIADFGIAKLNQSSLTIPGSWLGSPAYMAPEQLAGEEIDGRADLFSLGVILYTMLTGHRPFQGNTMATVIYRVVNHKPLPISALQPEIPEDLDKVVLRAIAKDRAERFQNGAEMAAAMRQLRDKQDTDGQNPQWMRMLSDVPAATSSSEHEKRPNFIKQQTERIRTMVQVPPEPFESRAYKQRNKLPKILFILAAIMMIGGGLFWRSRHHSPATPAPGHIATTSTFDREQVKTQPGPSSVTEANLSIEIEHHLASAQASLWLDGKLVYSHSLKGETKQHALLFKQTKGFTSHNLRIAAGKHEIRVRIKSADNSYDQTQTVVGDCPASRKNILHITADKHLKIELR
jgi:serine/threonine protein kinase